MIKTVFKEIIIMLLLCVAILLILGVLFYDYIPANKIVPNKVAYEQPESVAQELSQEVEGEEFVNIIYELDDAQLEISRKNREYNPGKQNPFAQIATEETNATNEGNNTQGANNNTTSGTNTNTSANKTTSQSSSTSNEYLPNKGKK